MTKAARVTRLTAPSNTGKTFTIAEDGTIAKLAAGNHGSWNAVTRAASTAEELAEVIDDLSTRGALALGIAKGGVVDEHYTIGYGTGFRRTAQNFSHADSEGWALVDFDAKAMPDVVKARIAAAGGLLAALERICPTLARAERLVRYSSSAGMYKAGDPEPPIDDLTAGRHIFVLLKDQSQSRAFLQALTAWSFQLGYGFVAISKSGALLERSIVDASVWGAERLVFAGPVTLGEGLARTVPPPQIFKGEAIDCPALPVSDLWRREILRLKAKAQPEADRIAREWRKVHIRKKVAAGVPARQAIAEVRRFIEGGVLFDSDTLEQSDGTELTVGEILDRVEASNEGHGKWHLPDPIEGASYGASTAAILFSAGRDPIMVSHAHGLKTTYTFARYQRAAAPILRPVQSETLPPVGEARPQLEAALTGFMDAAVAWHHRGRGDALVAQNSGTPLSLFAVGLGIGKTTAAIAQTVKTLRTLNDEEDAMRVAEGRNPRADKYRKGVKVAETFAAVYAVPTHKLADQVADDFEALGVKVVHLRGPDAEDPAAEPDDSGNRPTMCRKAEAYTTARAFMQDTRELCKKCEHRDGCAYLTNQRARGDVYVVTHAELATGRAAPPVKGTKQRQDDWSGLFGDEGKKPKEAYRQRMAFLIVDEDPLGTLTYGTTAVSREDLGTRARLLNPAKLTQSPLPSGFERSYSKAMRLVVKDLVQAHDAGEYLCLAKLRAIMARHIADWMGDFHAALSEAARGEYERRADTVTPIPMTVPQYVAEVGANTTIKAVDRLYAELEQALTASDHDTEIAEDRQPRRWARIQFVEIEDKEGEKFPAISMSGVAVLGRGYNCPTLLLDATAEPLITERLFDRAPKVTTIRAAEPTLDVVQDPTKSGSKTQLLGLQRDAEGRKTAMRWRAKIAAWVKSVAAQHPHGFLVVFNKSVEVKLLDEVGTIEGVTIAHFNNLRGRNDFEQFTGIAVIGRTQPSPQNVALICQALTAEVIAVPKATYTRGEVERLVVLADGSHAMAKGFGIVADALPAAVVRAILSAEIEQAIGRLRGVNRTAPLTAFVLSDAVLQRPVRLDQTLWAQIKSPGPIDRQLAMGSVAFGSPTHAARAYPQLWATTKAALREWEKRANEPRLVPYSQRDIILLGIGDQSKREVRIFSYRVPRKGETYFAAINASALGDTDHLDHAQRLIAGLVKGAHTITQVDARALPAPQATAPNAKRLVVASPTGLMADLDPIAPAFGVIARRERHQADRDRFADWAHIAARPTARAKSPVRLAVCNRTADQSRHFQQITFVLRPRRRCVWKAIGGCGQYNKRSIAA